MAQGKSHCHLPNGAIRWSPWIRANNSLTWRPKAEGTLPRGSGGVRSCRGAREVDGRLLHGDVGEAHQTQGWDSRGDHSVALMAHHP